MKRIFSCILFLFFITSVTAQVKKQDTIKGKRKLINIKTPKKEGKGKVKGLAIKTPVVFHKLDSSVIINGSKSTAIYDVNSANFVLKDIKFIDPYSSNSDVYGERKIEVITDDFNEINESVINDVGAPEVKGSNLVCVSQNINLNANSSSFFEFSKHGAPSWLKPGVILDIGDFLDGSQVPLIQERNPIKISTSIATGGAPSYVDVDEPHSMAELQSAVNTLRVGNVSANFVPVYSEIHSIEELGFQIYGSYHNNLVGLNTNFGVESNKEKQTHYYKVDLFQNMYSLDVDRLHANDVFKGDQPNMQNLVYISRVNYGRRAIVILESEYKLNESQISGGFEIDRVLQGGELDFERIKVKVNQGINVKAVFYGGNPQGAFQLTADLIRGGAIPESLETYFNNLQSDPTYALPISYEISNMNGQRLGMRSVFNQTIQTCTKKLTETKRLKVTLRGIQSIKKRHPKTDYDKYGMQQYVEYKQWEGSNAPTEDSGTNIKYVDREIRKFESIIDDVCENGESYENKMIHGRSGSTVNPRQTPTFSDPNINNSLTFEVTPKLFEEGVNTRFRFHTWVKEYTTRGDYDAAKILDWEYIDVDLKLVVQYLLDPDAGYMFDKSFYDPRVIIEDGGEFIGPTSNGVEMYLARDNNNSMQGLIYLKKDSANTTAVAWYNFQFVD